VEKAAKQGGHDVHGAPLGADEIAAARQVLGWSAEPFVIPQDVLADWRELGARGAAAIYTSHIKPSHIIRKVILRQIAIVNYVNPF